MDAGSEEAALQDAAIRETLSVEAKLTRGDLPPRQAPTLDASGVLDVRTAQQVYLDLDAAQVSSVYREGADLVLVGPDRTALRLQGFFSGDTPRRLFLEGDNNRLAAVDTAAVASEAPVALVTTPLTELSPFVSLTQAGGAAIAGSTAAGGGIGAAGVLGGVAAIGGLAAAAAGGGGGGGGGSPSPPQPPAPDTTAPAIPAGLAVDARGTTLTGRGEAGATVTVRNGAGTVIGTATVGADGTFSVALQPAQANGGALSVTLADAAGNVSGAATVTAPDITAPAASSAVDVADDGGSVSGRGEPGAAVTVRGADGAVLGTGTVDGSGAFLVALSSPLTNGETVTVTLRDGAGNTSAATTAQAPDTTPPAVATNLVVSGDGASLSGVGEPGATITVTGPGGGVIGQGTVDADGGFTVLLSPPQVDGESLGVVQTDPAGNPSPAVTAAAPDLNPQTPDSMASPTVVVAEAANGVSAAEVADGIQVRVLLAPDVQEGDYVTLTVGPQAWTATVTSGAANVGVLQFTLPAMPDGSYTATATVWRDDGDTSAPSQAVTFLVDSATAAPTIAAANGAVITGAAEAGATITLLNAGGATVATVRAGADGSWSVPGTVVAGGLDGFQGTVRATDVAGNAASSAIGPVDGSIARPLITGANGAGVSGVTEPGATVVLLTAAGAVAATVTAGPTGAWSIAASLVAGGLDGFDGAVRATDAAGNTASTNVGPIDGSILLSVNIDPVTADNIINLAEAAAGAVTVSGAVFGEFIAGTTVTLTLSNGETATGSLNANGTWAVSFSGAQLSGATTVTARIIATDLAGNAVTISDTQVYGLDLTPPPAPLITSANSAGVSGTAEPGATITLLDAGGTPITSVATAPDGRWTLPAALVPGGLDGFAGSVVVTDPPGNPTRIPVGPIDGSIAAPVVTEANGVHISGTAEAGATVTLLDADGRPVATVTAGPSGVWTVQASSVPAGLDGFTGAVRATDPAGNVAIAPLGPVDGAIAAPVILAANGGGISGVAEPGAQVTLRDAGGASLATVAAGPDGAFSFPAGAVPGGLDGFTGSVTAVDAAGNAAAAAVGPIDGQVLVSLSIDPLTADNTINGAEALGSVLISGRAIGEFTAGQTVTVTLPGGATLTAPLAADGSFSIAASGATLAGASLISVSLSVTDAGGNAATVTSTRTYGVDLDGQQPVITRANGVGISGFAETGAPVVLLDGSGAVIASTVAAFDGAFSFAASVVPGGLDGFGGAVRSVDPAGNPATTLVGPIDGSTTTPVIVTANGAAIAGTAEAGATVLLLGAGGVTVATVTAGPGGAWTIPAASVGGGLDGFLGVVRATDGAGNSATAGVGPIDGAIATPVVTGANGLGIEGTAEPGSTVVLRDAGGATVATVVTGTNGVWDIPASAVPGGLDGFQGTVTASDAAGNSAAAAVGPVDGSVTLSINVDSVTADNAVNAAEAATGTVTVSGAVFGDFVVGATVTVSLSTGVATTAVLGADGRWSAGFAGSALAAATSVTATVSTTDQAGNAAVVSDTQAYAVDTTPPAAPVVITANGAGLGGTATAGSVITLVDANGDPMATVTAAGDGTWTIPGVSVPGGLDGFTGSVTAGDPAGNTAATPVGPIDGSTLTPVVVQANEQGLAGLAEANAAIVLLGADGAPVLGAGGVPVTAVADGSGAWSIPASALQGGIDGFTGLIRATDAAGNTALGAVGPVDGDTPAPVILAANGAVLSGQGEPGATIALLDVGGAAVTDGLGAPITVLVAADGSWTIPAALLPGGLDGFQGQVRAIDTAGNTASTPVGPIDGTISLTLSVDPVTADNVLNGAEAAQAAVTVSGGAIGEFTPGDVVRVELSTGVFATTTLAANGAWSVTFTGAQLAGATGVTVSASVEDNVGNTVTVSDVQPYTVDISTTAPVITSANGAGISGTAEAGALITLRGTGGQALGSAVADGTGVWTMAAADIQADLNGLSGSLQAVDAAGNVAVTPLATVDGVLNLAITVDPVTADNIVNLAESGLAGVTVTGSVAGEHRTGDTVVVTLANGQQQTTTLDAAGAWAVTFAGADLAVSQGLSVVVTSADAAGNAGSVTVQHGFAVDTQPPAPPVVTSAGALGLSGTGEPGATVQLQTGAGQPVVGSSGQPIIATVAAGGGWTIPASAFFGGVPPGFSGQVVAVDPAGNPSTATAVPAIDLTPPDGSTTSVAIGPIASDDIVNQVEAQGTVTVTGSVSGEFRAGDVVIVTVGAATVNTTVAANGAFSVGVPGAAFAAGGQVQAAVQASDAAGNVGVITGVRAYGADLIGPGGAAGTQAPGLAIAAAADGLVSPGELSSGVSATVTLTPSAIAGDTVVLTLSGAGAPRTFSVTLSASDVAAGTVTLPMGSSLVDGAYSASAVIRDASGNTSAPSAVLAFQVDAVALGVGSLASGVSEAALGVPATGTLAIAGATGAVSVSLQAPAGTFTSHGQLVTWATEAGGALVGSAGGRAVARITVNAAGAYSVVLLDALDHPTTGADILQLPIGVTVTDSTGSSAGTLLVTVTDGTPALAAPVVLAPTQPAVIVGSLVQTPSADGDRLASVTIDGRTFTYNTTSGAVAVTGAGSTIVSYGVAGGRLTATTVRGETVVVDFATGDYRIDVTGVGSRPATQAAPTVALGGGQGLLGLIDADVLGLIQLDEQQFFTASDVDNDISEVIVRYSAAVGLGLKTFSFSAALAAELGLTVTQANTFLLPGSSQLTIKATSGGAIDNLKLNEFLGSITISGGLSGLLDLNVAQTLSIQARDVGGRVTIDSESTLADLGVAAALLGGSQPSQILTGGAGVDTITASDAGSGAALDNRLYGYGGDDTLNAGLGNDLLRGGAGADTLNGGAGNDLLIGGTGNDILTGGAGQDVFRWEAGDQGVSGGAADVIRDFNTASLTLGGDVLDLSSLLQGEGRIGASAGNLTNYIHFQQTANGTLIHISTSGGFVGGFGSSTSGTANQTILLQNVDLTSGFTSDQAILADLLTRGKLVVDTSTVDGSTASPTLVVGGSVIDGDGDGASTTVSINGSGVQPTPPLAGNVAPAVELQAQNVLGLLGLGALGLNLNNQDLLAADANGNLNRVEVEYAPLVAVNLSPLTFGFDATLAASYGLQVQVTRSSGLLGIVAPTARIVITALDGGILDNVEINRFLETVHLTDTSGGLLSSSLLSVDLLNAMTITAHDAQGLSSSAALGSVLNVNLLNSLDGPDPVGLAALSADEQVAMIGSAQWGEGELISPPEPSYDSEATGLRSLDPVMLDTFVEDRSALVIDFGEDDALLAPGVYRGDVGGVDTPMPYGLHIPGQTLEDHLASAPL
ncbi:Ig-like domain-containing protein [Caulobacter endophyticus]|uniref:Ig-like domain-containing protein n=1 Tax=Caulobacter endophyticus TaxID=2172652 RepID=UPI0024103908|nr:Ig-like domain-containing protein [Caulobacter endophyticus]MDG2527224.1 Ig-like domain-containing protein [Caulobacter endophyticus]